jgi:pyruvate dehydrogenase E2 component (dihydrolipoamide acetyltransferase)
LPELGDNITGGDVIGILVAVGDVIKEGQDIVELETDKATVTVPSSVSGKVTAINVAVGQRAAIGQVILTVSGAAVAAAPAEVSLPGAFMPEASERTATPSSSTAPAVPVAASTATRASITEVPLPDALMPDAARSTVPAAPNARRLARELGVEVADVPPSATGRVTLPGLKDYVRQRNQGLVAAPASAASAAPVSGAVVKPLPDFTKWGEIEIEKMSGIRRATSNQMAYAWSVAPRVTQFDKADIVELEAVRKKYGSRVEKSGAKLTMTAMLLKIAAAALKEFPKFNASIDVEHEQIILKKYFHIGVAVDTPHGLVVPVIRDVDRKSIFDLAIELNTVAGKARDRKLSVDEMQGGCFTISNLGGIGGTNFTPIVNAPEVAILGVSRGAIEPVYNGEAFEPRLMMPLSLSYDHRLIDGAQGARFLRWICNALENPMLMSLQAW